MFNFLDLLFMVLNHVYGAKSLLGISEPKDKVSLNLLLLTDKIFLLTEEGLDPLHLKGIINQN